MDAVIRKFTPPADVDHVYAVIVSTDGGATWAPCGPNGRVGESIEQLQGDTQGAWNMSIAVSPNPNTIAVGFRRGPWIGRNTSTAFTWEEHGDDGSGNNKSADLHADIHGLNFDPHDPQGKTLYVCSDGGMAFTTDLWTFQSSVNRFLPVLQFQSYPAREWDGVSGVSFSTPGLVAGVLQDNGIVFSPLQNGIQGPWHYRTKGGDGRLAIFLKNDLLLSWHNDDPVVRASKWNGSQFGDAMEVTVRTPSPYHPLGKHFARAVGRASFRSPVSGTGYPGNSGRSCGKYQKCGTLGAFWQV